jgi:hypothetical protein
LPHQPALRDVMKMLVGEQAVVHPKPSLRTACDVCTSGLRIHGRRSRVL